MTGQQLKNSILQEAIQGHLVPNVLEPGEKTGVELLQGILAERQKKENEEKGKKAKKLTLSTIEEEPWDLPEGWCWCKLGDLVYMVSGTSYGKGDVLSTRTESSVRVLRGGNIIDEQILYCDDDVFISSSFFDETKTIKTNDIVIIGSSGSKKAIAKASIALEDDSSSQIGAFLRIIRNYNQSILPFVWMIFRSAYYKLYIADIVKGTNINNIKSEYIEQFDIPLPPLSIQKAIVAKIEELFPLVDEYDKSAGELETLNKNLPDKLRKSVLLDAICGRLVPQNPSDEPAIELIKCIRKEKTALVKTGRIKIKDLDSEPILSEEYPFEKPLGWEFVRLSEISLDSADGPFGSNLKKEHYTDQKEVRIIQLSNIGEFGWRDSNVKYTTFEHLKTISRSEAFAGDIIIAKMMPAGRAIICPDMDIKYVLSSDAVRFDFSSILNKRYLYYAINSPVFKDQVYGEVQGITRVRTSLSKLRTYILPIPPLSEQKRIVEKIEEVFAAIDKLQA